MSDERPPIEYKGPHDAVIRFPRPASRLPSFDDLAWDIETARSAPLHPPELIERYLFRTLRVLAAGGGTGKTALLLHEAACLALGRPVFGLLPVLRSGRTLYITGEDSAEELQARLARIVDAMDCGRDERQIVQDGVRFLDLAGEDARLVEPGSGRTSELTFDLAATYQDSGIAHVVLDPLASFGADDENVNGNVQSLVNAARRIGKGLGAAVTLCHHVGKASARDGAEDAYVGRGGSALADGSRIVHVLRPVADDEQSKAPMTALAALREAEHGALLRLATPKMSHAPRPPALWIVRDGWKFQAFREVQRDPDAERRAQVEQVLNFVTEAVKRKRFFTQNDLEAHRDEMGLTREEVRRAVSELKVSGRLVLAPLPKRLCAGARKHYLCPADSVPEREE
ncbi:MAG: hypothetical protein D6775_03765 [Caldilineae bacterium]|nr:MAG: hypothetical protein D6775_03765 [Caldilineae bacterium]